MNELGKPDSTVRNGDTLQWCSINVAVDLLGHRYRKKYSSLDAGFLAFNGKFQPDGYMDADYVLKDLINSGGCLERDLPSTDTIHSSNGQNILPLRTALLRAELLAKRMKDNSLTSVNEDDCAELRDLFPGLSNKLISEVVTQYSNIEVLGKLAENTCRNREQFPNPKPIVVHRSKPSYVRPSLGRGPTWDADLKKDLIDQKAFLGAIDEQLNRDNAIGLSYDVRLIEPLKGRQSRLPIYDNETRHASTIVGRKYFDGGCKYLLRNVWGPEYESRKAGVKNENGYHWVSESELYKYSGRITYLN